MKRDFFKKLLLGLIIGNLFTMDVVEAGQLSRDVTYNNYDLSKLPANLKVPLIQDSTGTTMGIFRAESKNGVVLMSKNGPISKGSGVFLGTKDKIYNKEISAILIRSEADGYTKISDDLRVAGLFYEGIIQDPIKIDNLLYAVVKPKAGMIKKLFINGNPVQLLETNLVNAQIKTANGKEYGVFFLSTVNGQQCFLIEPKE